ncbi:ABC transporter substrate-binding protein [Roseibium denhamense]|uniref:Glycine betaine/proline transport system substrate-binding protein n=1 Tax=Roseibium denhamense TaxID=76305 RepID=A0ABY1PM78_9HYPH|nr:ABC transporter substrate-binding protein [Roseibium denhamense]MTI04338.1 ABC transporter substrate-binding protein [Roseibium denhamense]SMP37214.1 glycine betaine/proline transport system substrate-binding protein [Roseibium denhamense]
MNNTKKLLAGLVTGFALTTATAAQAECGDVSITEMNWASSQIITEVSKFLMEQGYGCTVEKVPSATTTSVASLAENGEPDIVTELWLNSTGDVYAKLEADGKVSRLADVFDPGGVEGWWIPSYLAEKHPELSTIEGVMANPELVGGRFNNCPDGWGCRIVNDNLINALGMRNSMEVFDHGSGETLATSIAAAYENQEPWFGYYYGPTAVLGKYAMTKVAIGAVDADIHASNQNKDTANPGVSDFPPAPVLTVATAALNEKEPEIAALMGKVSFETGLLSSVLAWQEENSASAEEAAVYFLTNHSDVWSQWVNDAAREKLAAFIK